MKSSKKNTVWYIEPKTQNVNGSIADLLGSDVTASEQYGVICKDGKRRDMWMVEYSTVKKIFHSEHLSLFKVFRSQDGRHPSDVTKIIANFFRPKVSKAGRVKKGSEIIQPKKVFTKVELEKMGIHSRPGSGGVGIVLYRIGGSCRGEAENQLGYGTNLRLAIENAIGMGNGHWFEPTKV